MGQSSYVPKEYHTTVGAMVDEAKAELVILCVECMFAASRFPTRDHPKAEAFRKAAFELSQVDLTREAVPAELEHKVVVYEGQKTRRTAHKMARWCRAENLGTGLRRAAQVVSELKGPQSLQDLLAGSAMAIEAVVFPTLYDQKGDKP